MLSGAVYSAHHPLRCRTELAVSFSHHYNSSRFGDFDANAHIYDILERLLFAEICLLRCVIVDVVRYQRYIVIHSIQPMVRLGFYSLFTFHIYIDAFNARLVENVLELRLRTFFHCLGKLEPVHVDAIYPLLNGLKHVVATKIPLNVIK